MQVRHRDFLGGTHPLSLEERAEARRKVANDTYSTEDGQNALQLGMVGTRTSAVQRHGSTLHNKKQRTRQK